MAVELNDTTIPATYQLAERTGTLPARNSMTRLSPGLRTRMRQGGSQVRRRLPAGGNRIRTIGPAEWEAVSKAIPAYMGAWRMAPRELRRYPRSVTAFSASGNRKALDRRSVL